MISIFFWIKPIARQLQTHSQLQNANNDGGFPFLEAFYKSRDKVGVVARVTDV
jgi:hypothetical protein